MTGKIHTKELIVTEELTAKTVGSGGLRVFATPMMIALMEQTAAESVQSELEEGYSTVGTMVNVKHVSATPVGMRVRCETKLLEQDGRRMLFRVACYDDAGLIGEGEHERFAVQSEKFMAKTEAKK